MRLLLIIIAVIVIAPIERARAEILPCCSSFEVQSGQYPAGFTLQVVLVDFTPGTSMRDGTFNLGVQIEALDENQNLLGFGGYGIALYNTFSGATQLFTSNISFSAGALLAPGATRFVEFNTTFVHGTGSPPVGSYSLGMVILPAVPELSTWAMMLLGFAVIAIGAVKGQRRATGTKHSS